MTQTGSSNAIVNVMLGWLKGLASWVLRLFNLSAGFSPLKFLANNWLKLLILLLIVGMAADLLIWLIRWRPHWVWFHKKRVIINDKNFFDAENEPDDVEDEWAVPEEFRRARREERNRRDWRDNDFVVAEEARRRARARELRLAAEAQSEVPDDVFTGEFNVNAKQKFSDRYEDEVFSVSNLPRPQEGAARGERPARRPAGNRRANPRAERPAQRRREAPEDAHARRRSGERPASAQNRARASRDKR